MAESKQNDATIVDSTRRIVVKTMSTGAVLTTTWGRDVFSDKSNTYSVILKVVADGVTYTGGGDYKNQRLPNMNRDIPIDKLSDWVLDSPVYLLTVGDICIITYHGPEKAYTNPLAICIYAPDSTRAELNAKVATLTNEIASLKIDLANQVAATDIAAKTCIGIKEECQQLKFANETLIRMMSKENVRSDDTAETE